MTQKPRNDRRVSVCTIPSQPLAEPLNIEPNVHMQTKPSLEIMALTRGIVKSDHETVLLKAVLDKLLKLRQEREEVELHLENSNSTIESDIEDLQKSIKLLTSSSFIEQIRIHNPHIFEDYEAKPGSTTDLVHEIDRQKIRVTQELTKLEAEISQMKLQKMELSNEAKEVQEPALRMVGGEHLFDKELILLNLFKNMGLRLETVDEKDQLIIQDSNSLHAFAINSDYGDYFTSNMLWDKMGAD